MPISTINQNGLTNPLTSLASNTIQVSTGGSASAPAISKSDDTNTGMFFPAADTIAFTEGGTEAMRLTSAGDVGIGTSSPSGKLEVSGGQLRVTASNASSMFLVNPSTTYADGVDLQATYNGGGSFGPLKFTTSSTERMRITSTGELLVNSATGNTLDGGRVQIFQTNDNGLVVRTTSTNYVYVMQTGQGSNTGNGMLIRYGNSVVGSIQTNGSSTSYVTSSDYRLKENIAPMTGALAKVAQLKPVTYTWKSTGKTSQGFIAHELQAVVPDCVTGEKDAIDEEGNPVHQGVDTSFLVATLTAAIQELKAEFDAYKASHP